MMGYAHVGHAIQLKGSGEAEVVMDTTERLGEGVGLPDVAPVVTAMLAAKVNGPRSSRCCPGLPASVER